MVATYAYDSWQNEGDCFQFFDIEVYSQSTIHPNGLAPITQKILDAKMSICLDSYFPLYGVSIIAAYDAFSYFSQIIKA